MKCILLNSPIYEEHSEFDEMYLPPLGLGYIATHLQEAGIDVEIIDCVKARFGIKEIQRVLKEKEPDFIGINVFTQNYDIVKSIVEDCPVSSTVIVGGQVVKSIYLEILRWNVKNELILIIGEGELILPALLSGKCEEVPIYSDNGKSVYIVNQESKYFPVDLSSVHLNRAFLCEEIINNHYGQKEAAIITSRGCMYNCAFCGGARSLNHDISIRQRNPQDVMSEVREIMISHPEVTCIRVLDDLFLKDSGNMVEAINIFGEFKNLNWRGMAHVQTFLKSFDLLDSLQNSGCREIFLGIESGAEKIRKYINKAGTVDQILTVGTAILTAGIDVKGYFIYGFPNETQEDFLATYQLAAKLKEISCCTKGVFRSSVFQFRPYHGTRLYNEIIDSGRKVESIAFNSSISNIKGRSQFNFESGNYSQASYEILNSFILKTQQL